MFTICTVHLLFCVESRICREYSAWAVMCITSNCFVCTTCAVVYNVPPVLLCICRMYCCLYATSHVLFVVYHMSCYVYSTYTLACKYEYSTYAVVYCISHVCCIYTTCAIICYMRCCLYITTCVVFYTT